jgi:hypothetical protein
LGYEGPYCEYRISQNNAADSPSPDNGANGRAKWVIISASLFAGLGMAALLLVFYQRTKNRKAMGPTYPDMATEDNARQQQDSGTNNGGSGLSTVDIL